VTTSIRLCAIVPTYNNPTTIRDVVLAIREHVADVIVIDDGSGAENRAACRSLADEGLAHLRVRATNGGKGAAVKDGLAAAHELGFTHALQIDADLQHDTHDIPAFAAAARSDPDALILGQPVFDASAPRIRLMGRQITRFLTHVETAGRAIADPMCGFRVYPVRDARAVRSRGNAMDFDPEIAVKMRWRGTRIVNLPTRVRYHQGGVSNFRQFTDNALLTWMHIRLLCLAPFSLLLRRRRPPASLPERSAQPSEPPTWLSTREKGSVLGLRFLVFLGTIGGRRLARLIVRLVALYFVVVHRSIRRASRGYFARLTGSPASFGTAYRHVFRFAGVIVDRFFLVKRRFDLFQFTETGKEHLDRLRERGTGALLIGGHFGSYEAMRALSAHAGLVLNVVGYFRNARVLNDALEKLDPGCNVRLIEVDPSSVGFVFRIKSCIERGELVAILADRVGLSGGSVKAQFLGAEARFSSGPYALAASLRCPVYFTAAIYREPNRYDLHCEPFAEQIVLPRSERQAALTRYAQKFADRLEHHCRSAPDNWFNFYDFWASPTERSPPGSDTASQGMTRLGLRPASSPSKQARQPSSVLPGDEQVAP
jgi:predicted LPLAT superfamily acyltransferase